MKSGASLIRFGLVLSIGLWGALAAFGLVCGLSKVDPRIFLYANAKQQIVLRLNSLPASVAGAELVKESELGHLDRTHKHLFFYQAGRELYERGMNEQAKRLLVQSLELAPSSQPATLCLAQVLRDEDRWQEAESLYLAALEREPESAAAHAGIAQLYGKLDRWDAAIPHYLAAANSDPGWSDVRIELGHALLRAGRPDAALLAYAEASRLDPHNTKIECAIASAQASAGLLAEAAASFEAVLRKTPQDATARNNYGEVLFRLGRPEAARTELLQAIRISPGYAQAYCNLGAVAQQQGSLDDALEMFAAALAVDPFNRTAGQYLARLSNQLIAAASTDLVASPTGLRYRILRDGTGPRPDFESVVDVHYQGWLDNGTVFESTLGHDPKRFPVEGLIQGWQEALRLISPGGAVEVVCPAELAYGETGNPPRVPPNSRLRFVIVLLRSQLSEPAKSAR